MALPWSLPLDGAADSVVLPIIWLEGMLRVMPVEDPSRRRGRREGHDRRLGGRGGPYLSSFWPPGALPFIVWLWGRRSVVLGPSGDRPIVIGAVWEDARRLRRRTIAYSAILGEFFVFFLFVVVSFYSYLLI